MYLICCVAVVCLSSAGISGAKAKKKGPIVVSSKIDTEGALLSQIIILVLRNHGFTVVDKSELGPTNLVRKAIISGQIDIYPEYTGNGAFFFKGTSSDVWKNAQKAYAKVKQLDKEKNNIVWLQPSRANNTWAMAVRQDFSTQYNVITMEDFASYVNQGGKVKLAASEEFVNRADVLPAFQKAYGFKLKSSQIIVLSGGNTAQAEKAAAEGLNGVNVAMAYGTDGALAALGLVSLEDNKNIQPVYEPAPIIRGTVLAKYPEIGKLLAPVFRCLNLESLQALNARIAVQGVEASVVAREYVQAMGFLS